MIRARGACRGIFSNAAGQDVDTLRDDASMARFDATARRSSSPRGRCLLGRPRAGDRGGRLPSLSASLLVVAAALLCWAFVPGGAGGAGAAGAGVAQTRPGDLDGNGVVDLSDPVYLLNFLFLGGPSPAPCDSAAEVTTIVVVRHAEKDGGLDPSLTDTGRERARRLVSVVRHLEPDLLLASTLRRTIETLEPLAEATAQPIETILDADEAVRRLEMLPPGSHAVVAHHSFTITSILSGLGVSDEDLAGVFVNTYDNLFIVQRRGALATSFVRLSYATDLVESEFEQEIPAGN